MSSLWNRKQKTIHLIIKKKNPTPTLQIFSGNRSLARGLIAGLFIKRIPLLHLLKHRYTKKVIPQIGRRSLDGSMTVEAAVVIPLLLFFFMNLMSAIEMIRLHGNVELALWKNGRIMTISGYANSNDNRILYDVLMHAAVVGDLGKEYLEESPLTYGERGLVFLESSYGEEECIDVKVTYQVSPLFDIPGFSSFRMANRYYARAWTGYSPDEVEYDENIKDSVFVTPYGEVYHENRGCSYLARNVTRVLVAQVYSARNDRGEPYSLCQICRVGGQEVVYITSDGNRYHEKSDCPTLVRTVITVERALAKNRYRPCSRCAK